MIDSSGRDIHVLRFFSSFVSVSHGRVIHVSEPSMQYCPLAAHFYKDLKNARTLGKDSIKSAVKSAIESKIEEYGFFTSKRKLLHDAISVPYGASEMIMSALKKQKIDSAVVVCDGAGTVVTDDARVVQGIGGRMNSLLLTSPIKEVIARLRELKCCIVFPGALIGQAEGVEKAVEAGYRKIAVTVCGHDSGVLKRIRRLESSNSVSVVILSVCTTGISAEMIKEILGNSDIVWSCASDEVRRTVGACAKLQISNAIPVFALTRKGLDFISAYSDDAEAVSGLTAGKQYLISNQPGGRKIKLGGNNCFLREEVLPVLKERVLHGSDERMGTEGTGIKA